jgi:hypothetical protein
MFPSHPANHSAIPVGLPPFVWADVVSPDSGVSPQLRRADWLTPYTAETIVEDAFITVARGSSPAAIAAARNWFSGLPARGIEVRVRLVTGDAGHGAWL